MVQLNLLPHRERARMRQRRRWHGLLGAGLAAGLLASGAVYGVGQQGLVHEQQATAVLEEAVAGLAAEAAEAQKLQASLREGRLRLQQWQAWQQLGRPSLQILSLLADASLADIGMTRIEQEPGQLVLQGVVHTREAAGGLREILDGSGVLAQPVLLADLREEKDGFAFRLVMPLVPAGASAEGGSSPGGAGE